jgi:MFS family permease
MIDMTVAALVAQFPYGIIADKYGRRIVLFLAVLGCFLQGAWVMLVCKSSISKAIYSRPFASNIL